VAAAAVARPIAGVAGNAGAAARQRGLKNRCGLRLQADLPFPLP